MMHWWQNFIKKIRGNTPPEASEENPLERELIQLRREVTELKEENQLLKSYGDARASQVLAILQREGRLIDFLWEPIGSYSDEEIGRATRSLHTGCRKAIETYFTIESIYSQSEEKAITISPGFDPAAVSLMGDVHGKPPFRGILKHHGWRVATYHLPPLLSQDHDFSIVHPAEVEITP